MMTIMMMIMTDPFTTNLVVKGTVVKGSVVKGAHPIVIVITITIVIIIIIALRWVASLRSCNINAKEKGRKEGGSKAKFTR